MVTGANGLLWLLPAAGLLFFAAGAVLNAAIAFGLTSWVRAARARGSHVSLIPLLPGLAGAAALRLAPSPDWQALFWLPLLLDVGCAPYLVLALFAGIAGIAAAFKAAPPAPPDPQRAARERAFAGCLLGTAVGDALGLPTEGLSRRRAARMFPPTGAYRFLPFGRGMFSDDTEHSLLVGQALVESGGDADRFRTLMAWKLRWWLLGLPAGIGMATLKSAIRLWLFLPRRWQGTHSAGNAPAMRSALIGLFWRDDPMRLRRFVAAATTLTHTDPKAAQAALVVALAARASAAGTAANAAEFAAVVRDELGSAGGELAGLVERVAAAVAAGQSTPAFADALGLADGVSGYAFHTVPVALHAWLSYPADYRAAVRAAIACGGDTDTVAAITGAIVGAGVGPEGIPAEWLERLAEWPRDRAWIASLAAALAAAGEGAGVAPRASGVAILLRNLFFLAVVLAHGFRRLLPPY